jgi:hypothetical protein
MGGFRERRSLICATTVCTVCEHAQPHTVAIFRQINKGALHTNHDALEFPDGEIVLLTRLYEGQNATVLTLPTQPKTTAEAEAQQRGAYVG